MAPGRNRPSRPTPPSAVPDSVSLAETLNLEGGAEKRGKVPLGEGVYAGLPKHAVSRTTTDALVRMNARVDTHTSVHTQTHRDSIFLRINSRATLIKILSRGNPWADAEKHGLVCCPRP